MLYDAFNWFWQRYRPAEGWLSLFLLLAAMTCLTGAITAVEWVPEDSVVVLNGLLGLLLGIVVARGPLRPFAAWLLIFNYGLVLTLVHLGQLLPDLSAVFGGTAALDFRRQWLLLFDRIEAWSLTVSGGGSSNETIVFALGLGLLIWFLAAFAAWSTYRRHRPLLALSFIALTLALNGYFSGGSVPAWFTALFIAITVVIAAAMHYANMERTWIAAGIDYSREIRVELLALATGVAIALLALSFVLPAIRLRAMARAFQESAPVQQVEETMQRAFAGVRRPRGEVVATAGGGGVMPRAYLLGNAPELYETVVFTASVDPPAAYGAGYWRGLSYDVYTGRGWALSNERSEPFNAGQRLPAVQGQRVLTQTVHRHTVDPQVRYTLGYPRTFADPVTVYWRGADDFSRASAPGASYTATTTLLATDPADLRRANAAPDLVLARYTNLPDEIPRRVLDLAQEVTAAYDNDYDRARALETFLRQYPYSLEVEPPPSGRDPVDFFLFDLQRGYCDYYASSMVVMARSVGLPARLVVGYRAQPPDELGAQTMYQINAHAWVEVYFDGYGWVTFEPTAAFPTDTQVVEEGDPLAINEATPAPPALPPAPGTEPSVAPWLSLLLLVVLVAAWFWWLRRPRRAADGDTLVWAYERVQQQARRLGQPTPPSQTPAEFGSAFLARLSAWAGTPRFGSLLRGARPAVERLVSLYMRRQYSRPQTGAGLDPGPRRNWQRLLRRLWLFGTLKRLLRRPD